MRHPSDELGNLAQHRKLCRQVGDGGKVGSDARPDIDVGEGVGASRTDAALIIV